MKKFSVYFFDIDGTLTEFKQKIYFKIARKLTKLAKKNKVVLITGENFDQIEDKVLKYLKKPNFNNIYLLATSGAFLMEYDGAKYKEVYNHEIAEDLVPDIERMIKESFNEAEVAIPRKFYGSRLEYRKSQITFSANGQDAALEIKKKWDIKQRKRKKVVEILKKKLPDFEISIGGSNSIDITKKGINKAYGINNLCNHLKIDVSDCIFIGDGIYDGGNDFSVTQTDIKFVRVSGPAETSFVLDYFLEKQSIWTQILNPIYWFKKIMQCVAKIFGTKHKNHFYIENIENLQKKLESSQREAYLTRSQKNPILSPTDYSWEKEGVFNPAAIYLNGRVHVLYRAIGADGVSTIGYASSEDGIHFDERLPYPIYYPRSDFELDQHAVEKTYNTDKFCSGGGWCGCEDPKITLINGRIFLFYVAFSGWKSVRVAMSSISVEDFLNKNWRWTLPRLCSPQGIISKSGGIFPEKINGKYVFFQRIYPNILVDFLDDLRFDDPGKLPQGQFQIPPSKSGWDSRKVSFGSVPIKTKYGWLVITHGVNDAADHQYHLGAMILDLNDPGKIIYRSPEPLLSPELWYENDWKPGVVYPCGAVNKDGTLLIYYGGGDKYVCVASAPFDYFVDAIINKIQPTLKMEKVEFKKINKYHV